MSSFPLPDGVVLRAAEDADAEALAELMNAVEEPLGGDGDSSAVDVRHYWSRSKDLKTWLAERDGRLVGSLEMFANDEGRLNADIYLHPELRGTGLDSTLVRISEDEARERGLRRIMNGILETDTDAVALLEREGYAPVRHFYRMTIDLTHGTPQPEWPAGFRLQPFELERDGEAVHAALEEASSTSGGTRPSRPRNGKPGHPRGAATRPSCGSSCATGKRSLPPRSATRSASAWAGSPRSRFVLAGAGAVSGSRCCTRPSPASADAARHWPGLVSMPKIQQAPRASTNEPGCAVPGRQRCTRRSSLSLLLPVPRLPDVYRGRDRARVSMPLVRPRVARRPRARPQCLGRGRRSHGGSGQPSDRVPRGRRDRGGFARRAEPRARGGIAGAAARPRWRCCSHVGAVEGLAARHAGLAVVWFDAHGDLNTPQTSPSGNAWGMPLRMILDSGAVEPEHVALVGARNLDPPEVEYIRTNDVRTSADAVLGRRVCLRRLRPRRSRARRRQPVHARPDGLALTRPRRCCATSPVEAGLIGGGHHRRHTDPRTSPSDRAAGRRAGP